MGLLLSLKRNYNEYNLKTGKQLNSKSTKNNVKQHQLNVLHQQSDRIHFHPITSRGLTRSSDGLTVHKKRGFRRSNNGISFSNRPVSINEVLVIEVSNVAVVIGFIDQDPLEVMKSPPKTSLDLVSNSLVFAFAFTKKQHQNIELYFNGNGDVYCSINGDDKSIIFRSLIPFKPHWALIELYNSDKNLQKLTSSTDRVVNIQNIQLKEEVTCCICYDEQANVKLGCGHEIICFECACKWIKLGKLNCPHCRSFIKSVIKVDSKTEKVSWV